MPIRDFSGAVCVVTGAADGLGAALARGLAAQGCRVALVDVDPRVHDVAATPLGVNPWGAWRGCRAFLPHLRRHREAHVVNVASAFALLAPPGKSAYAASKAAVRALTESLRAAHPLPHVITFTRIIVRVRAAPG